jgi:hypothetical protein
MVLLNVISGQLVLLHVPLHLIFGISLHLTNRVLSRCLIPVNFRPCQSFGHHTMACFSNDLIDIPTKTELRAPPTSMTVIAPQFNVSNTPEVLLATANRSIVVVDNKEAQDQELDLGPFAKMAVSPSGGMTLLSHALTDLLSTTNNP